MPRAIDWKPLILLAALVVGVTAWRVSQAQQSLWLDELHTAWSAGGELNEVAPRAAAGNQPPFYFWLLWGELRMVPPSELAFRGPSLVAGALLIAAVYFIAARWLGSPWFGLLAAWIIALEQGANHYAVEARSYALVTLLATAHVALFAELCRRPGWKLRAAFIVGAALLFHLHFTSALLFPAELLFWFVARVRRLMPVRYTVRQLTLDLALIGVLWLPAARTIGGVFGRRHNWEAFIPQEPFWHFLFWLSWSMAALWVLAAVLVDRYAIELPRIRSNSPDAGGPSPEAIRLRTFAILCLLWLLVPLTLAWLTTSLNLARLFFARYVVAAAPAAILLTATCARLAPSRPARIFVGLLLAGAALWINQSLPVREQEDWRGAVIWLNEKLQQQPLPVLVFSDLIEDRGLREPHDKSFEDFCLFPVAAIYRVNAPRGDLLPLPSHGTGLLNSNQRLWLRERGGAWIIVRTKELTRANASAEAVAAEVSADSPSGPLWGLKDNLRGERVHVVRIGPRAQTNEP